MKNGDSVPFPDNAKGISLSIFVVNDDVYVSGLINSGGKEKVAYWKNGELVSLSPGTKYAAANSIFVARTLGK